MLWLFIALAILIVVIVRRVTYNAESRPSKGEQLVQQIQVPLPVALGMRSRWISVHTFDDEAVVKALQLKDWRRMAWRMALGGAQDNAVSVTPNLGHWVTAYGNGLPSPHTPQDVEGIKETLVRLSATLGDAIYGCVDATTGHFCYIRAVKGSIVRVFRLPFPPDLAALDEGAATPEEARLIADFRAKWETQPSPLLRDELIFEVIDRFGPKFRQLGSQMDAQSKVGWIGLP